MLRFYLVKWQQILELYVIKQSYREYERNWGTQTPFSTTTVAGEPIEAGRGGATGRANERGRESASMVSRSHTPQPPTPAHRGGSAASWLRPPGAFSRRTEGGKERNGVYGYQGQALLGRGGKALPLPYFLHAFSRCPTTAKPLTQMRAPLDTAAATTTTDTRTHLHC